jgi:hypothetical protein
MIFPDSIYQDAGIGGDLCLDEIPDFQGLLPKANDVGVPVFAIEDNEIGESGSVLDGMIAKRDTFYELFDNISNKIISVCDHDRSV